MTSKGIKIVSMSRVDNNTDIDWGTSNKYDIMKREEATERGDVMHKETYSKDEIDLKFENLSEKVDSKFELLSQKIDNGFSNQTLQIENQLQAFKLEQVEAKKELTYWIIGTALTLAGVLIGALALF